MASQVGGQDFDELYRDERSVDGLPALTPWDIGGPQPVVQQLVAYRALRGEVLDPGTGPGHHAIYFASKGYAATGIDPKSVSLRMRGLSKIVAIMKDGQEYREVSGAPNG
jgi:SAM-dependent methyltransferase